MAPDISRWAELSAAATRGNDWHQLAREMPPATNLLRPVHSGFAADGNSRQRLAPTGARVAGSDNSAARAVAAVAFPRALLRTSCRAWRAAARDKADVRVATTSNFPCRSFIHRKVRGRPLPALHVPFGFFDIGRLASVYRQIFAEFPSTRRSGAIRAPDSTVTQEKTGHHGAGENVSWHATVK